MRVGDFYSIDLNEVRYMDITDFVDKAVVQCLNIVYNANLEPSISYKNYSMLLNYLSNGEFFTRKIVLAHSELMKSIIGKVSVEEFEQWEKVMNRDKKLKEILK